MTGEMPPQGLLTATGFAARETARREGRFPVIGTGSRFVYQSERGLCRLA
jgi:hypothetical protein